MKISLDGGITWKDSDEVRLLYGVLDNDGHDAEFFVTCTSEGIIQDAILYSGEEESEGYVGETSSQTAQEMFDELTEPT